MKYVQCELKQGDKVQVAWIEERGASVGKNVEIKDDSGRWDVTAVYNSIDSKSLQEFQSNSRNFKKKTDY
jgi:hypothetical protein